MGRSPFPEMLQKRKKQKQKHIGIVKNINNNIINLSGHEQVCLESGSYFVRSGYTL